MKLFMWAMDEESQVWTAPLPPLSDGKVGWLLDLMELEGEVATWCLVRGSATSSSGPCARSTLLPGKSDNQKWGHIEFKATANGPGGYFDLIFSRERSSLYVFLSSHKCDHDDRKVRAAMCKNMSFTRTVSHIEHYSSGTDIQNTQDLSGERNIA